MRPWPDKNEATVTDDDLRRDVAAELSWDPQIDSAAIAVSAGGGAVTLRGTVASLLQKRAVGRAAARIRGVTSVLNELEVQITDRDLRDDADLRGDVLEALMLDASVPMTVDAQVRDGVVTLTGTAQWHCQRHEAEYRTARVTGVVGIDNAIALTQAPGAPEALAGIRRALRRNAMLDADAISVDTASIGRVVLSGSVRSWAAHDDALAAAWSAPGVTEVDDGIRVEY